MRRADLAPRTKYQWELPARTSISMGFSISSSHLRKFNYDDSTHRMEWRTNFSSRRSNAVETGRRIVGANGSTAADISDVTVEVVWGRGIQHTWRQPSSNGENERTWRIGRLRLRKRRCTGIEEVDCGQTNIGRHPLEDWARWTERHWLHDRDDANE